MRFFSGIFGTAVFAATAVTLMSLPFSTVTAVIAVGGRTMVRVLRGLLAPFRVFVAIELSLKYLPSTFARC